MVLSRIGDIFSALSSRLSGTQSSTTVHKSSTSGSSSLLPPAASPHASNFSPSHKNLRLSSSLQDFSAYLRLDLEDGDLSPGNLPNQLKNPRSLQRDNAGSSFSKEKALLGGSPTFHGKNWTRLLALIVGLFLLALLIYTVFVYMYTYWSQGGPKFYVVLDCGSTSTRVYVYQASANHMKDNALPIVISSIMEGVKMKSKQSGRAYNRIETEPGFDKLVNNLSGLRRAIKPLLHWAEEQIPKNAHKSTSLYLYATAGVRRLPSADSKWLLDNAWSIVKKSPFLCQREWVKTITGTEEAYYGWIALNHGTGVLGATPRKPTFGALDLGGSSLQVTFERNEHNGSSLDLRIGTVNHHLSAYSLSGYGLNDAFGKSVVHLLKKLPRITNADLVNGKLELKHPCLQTGFNEQYVCTQCWTNLMPGKKFGKRQNRGISVRLIGAPNWEECSAVAKVAVNYSEWSNTSSVADCDVQPCALPDNFPHPFGDFYAISGFFVVYRFFNLSSEATLDDVLEKGRLFCEKSWEVARKSVAPQPFIEQYCFRAPYVVSLLREGLHITDKQIVIGSGSITWTLGVALLEAGKAFSTRPRLGDYEVLKMKLNPMVLNVLVIVSLLLLLCALIFVGNWMPRFFRRLQFRNSSASTTSVLSIPSPFWFQRRSPISSGDGRVKMPLSPTVAGSRERPFSLGNGFSSSNEIQMMETSYPSTSSVSHSYSSNSLGQMQFDSGGIGSFWSPHRSQMRLQSRRSQSREDLSSSIADTHLVKV